MTSSTNIAQSFFNVLLRNSPQFFYNWDFDFCLFSTEILAVIVSTVILPPFTIIRCSSFFLKRMYLDVFQCVDSLILIRIQFTFKFKYLTHPIIVNRGSSMLATCQWSTFYYQLSGFFIQKCKIGSPFSTSEPDDMLLVTYKI